MSKIKVGVIFGGQSTEHDVSVVSGSSVIKNLNKEKYEINQTNYTYRYYYNINDILCIKQDCAIKQCRCK